MARKDITVEAANNAVTNRLGGMVSQGVADKRKARELTAAEAEQLIAERKTRGHKGLHGPKICIVVSGVNFDFIRTMATVKGISQAQFVNEVLDDYRNRHGDDFNALQAILERMKEGGAI